jgi:hypothetical protein
MFLRLFRIRYLRFHLAADLRERVLHDRCDGMSTAAFGGLS